MTVFPFQLLHNMLNDVPVPSTSKSAEKNSSPSENKRRKKGKVHHEHVKTSTVSQNPENTVPPDLSPLSDLLTTTPPLAASPTSSNSASHNTGQPQSGFYRATVRPNEKEMIIPVLGSPP